MTFDDEVKQLLEQSRKAVLMLISNSHEDETYRPLAEKIENALNNSALPPRWMDVGEFVPENPENLVWRWKKDNTILYTGKHSGVTFGENVSVPFPPPMRGFHVHYYDELQYLQG